MQQELLCAHTSLMLTQGVQSHQVTVRLRKRGRGREVLAWDTSPLGTSHPLTFSTATRMLSDSRAPRCLQHISGWSSSLGIPQRGDADCMGVENQGMQSI